MSCSRYLSVSPAALWGRALYLTAAGIAGQGGCWGGGRPPTDLSLWGAGSSCFNLGGDLTWASLTSSAFDLYLSLKPWVVRNLLTSDVLILFPDSQGSPGQRFGLGYPPEITRATILQELGLPLTPSPDGTEAPREPCRQAHRKATCNGDRPPRAPTPALPELPAGLWTGHNSELPLPLPERSHALLLGIILGMRMLCTNIFKVPCGLLVA